MFMRPNIVLAQELDEQIARPNVVDALMPAMYSWSSTVRAALGLPVSSLAHRLDIAQPSATKLEHNESAGTITLARLSALARAMDCELVYGFVPNRPLVESAKRLARKQEAARRPRQNPTSALKA